MNVPWPYKLLAPRKVVVEPVYATMSGGRSITAVEQIQSPDAGYWTIQLAEIPCVSRGQKQSARAISAQLQGRLGLCDVPIYDDANAPYPLPVPGAVVDGALWSDGAEFGDRGVWETETIIATISGAVALGAISMVVNLTAGSEVEPGQHFSVWGASRSRLYRVANVTNVAGSLYTVKVWPPVREAITAGATAEFSRPLLTCRLATDGEMKQFVDDYAGRTLATINFDEALP